MSKLEQIFAFLDVIQEHGFAAAARKHGISTAAISRQVGRLEKDLGVQLLIRTTRQVSLTEAGTQYYKHCQAIVAELAEAESSIANSLKEATGTLHVTSTRYFAETHLLPSLSEFLKLNPKLTLKLELAERFPDLVEENIDVFFGCALEGPPDLVRKQVSTTRYVLCASPSYLKKYGTPKTPADLIKHRYITHSMRQPANVISFKNGKEIYVEPVIWLNDTRAMRTCALQDLGIIKLHHYSVDDVLQEGRLVEILKEFQEPKQPVYLYYKQSRYLQPKIRRFIDFYTSKL